MSSLFGADRLVLGTLHLRQRPEREVNEVLDAFLEAGGRTVDLATLYGGLPLLRTVGRHLRRSGVRVRSLLKIGYLEQLSDYRNPDPWFELADRAREALGLDDPTLMLHEADWALWWRAQASKGEVCTPADAPRIAACWQPWSERVHRLTGQALGIAGNHAPALLTVFASAGSPPGMTLLVAKQMDLLWRSAEPLVEKVQAAGGRAILGAPWHQGWLRSMDLLIKRRPELATEAKSLVSLCDEAGWSVADAALPFLLRHVPTALLAFGAATREEVEQAFRSLNRPLPDPLYQSIAALGRDMPPMGPLIPFECK
ncbi:hypothetical protein [Roseateles sp. BYS96W]|uniref:Aldo/keto reductase n=1 Tax=Pelomonas nitida TaxID=3299027 RepID=A0ABW7GCM7_9BURK